MSFFFPRLSNLTRKAQQLRTQQGKRFLKRANCTSNKRRRSPVSTSNRPDGSSRPKMPLTRSGNGKRSRTGRRRKRGKPRRLRNERTALRFHFSTFLIKSCSCKLSPKRHFSAVLPDWATFWYLTYPHCLWHYFLPKAILNPFWQLSGQLSQTNLLKLVY